MHIKTNIEHSPVQIIVLAFCPLLMVVSSVNDALFFMTGTILCLLVSQLILAVFNRYLTNNVKEMLTAIISALIVTAGMILVKDLTNKILPETSYFIIFSTMILNAEFIYFRSRAVVKYYFLSVLRVILIFVLLGFSYGLLKEFMAYGTLFEVDLLLFDGFDFCKTMVFNLFVLAALCALFDYVVRVIDKARETQSLVYQKYVKIIRNEKTFQYDRLRREHLLTNEIEVNKLSKADAEKLKQKESENETIDSVQAVVTEGGDEVVEPSEETEEKPQKSQEEEPANSKKRGRKSKKGGK